MAAKSICSQGTWRVANKEASEFRFNIRFKISQPVTKCRHGTESRGAHILEGKDDGCDNSNDQEQKCSDREKSTAGGEVHLYKQPGVSRMKVKSVNKREKMVYCALAKTNKQANKKKNAATLSPVASGDQDGFASYLKCHKYFKELSGPL